MTPENVKKANELLAQYEGTREIRDSLKVHSINVTYDQTSLSLLPGMPSQKVLQQVVWDALVVKFNEALADIRADLKAVDVELEE